MQKTVVTLIDDVSKKEVAKGGETIAFAFEGQSYEIDLNPLNAANFRRSMAKYVENGRKVTSQSRKQVDGRKVSHDRDYVHKVRQWAKDNGHEVAERGRVPLALYKAYEDATR